jgi:hypothetical protein
VDGSYEGGGGECQRKEGRAAALLACGRVGWRALSLSLFVSLSLSQRKTADLQI